MWPSWSVAVLVVAIMVWGRHGCGCYGLWPLWLNSVIGLYQNRIEKLRVSITISISDSWQSGVSSVTIYLSRCSFVADKMWNLFISINIYCHHIKLNHSQVSQNGAQIFTISETAFVSYDDDIWQAFFFREMTALPLHWSSLCNCHWIIF